MITIQNYDYYIIIKTGRSFGKEIKIIIGLYRKINFKDFN